MTCLPLKLTMMQGLSTVSSQIGTTGDVINSQDNGLCYIYAENYILGLAQSDISHDPRLFV